MRVFFFFSLYFLFIFCREGSDSFDVKNNEFIYLSRFGFYNGGTAKLNITFTDTTYNSLLFGCKEYAWRQLYIAYITEDYCSNTTFQMDGCYINNFTYTGNISFTVKAEKLAIMYYFGLISCESSSTTADMDFIFLNPGNQQLSSEYVPLPSIYLLFTILWIPILLLWIYNWIKHKNQKSKLHRAITIFPISKLIWVISGCIFWYLASNNPYFETAMVATYATLRLICLCMLVCIFVLISRGWGIINDNHKKNNEIIACGFVILFFIGSILGIYLGGLFQFTMILLYAFLVFFLFTFTNQSIDRLETISNNPDADIVGIHLRGRNVIQNKKRMLRRFNKLMVIFCIFQITIALSDTVFLYNIIWVGELAYEMVDWLMFICIGISLIFRLRKDNIYYDLTGAGGSASEKSNIINHNEPNYYSTAIEPENEADSTNPYDYHDIGPGMAVCIKIKI